MGKGDRKTRRGKLFSGSYGVLRTRKKKSGFSVVSSTKKTVSKKVSTPVEPKEVKAEPVKAVKEAKPEAKKPAARKPAAKKTATPKEEKPKKED